MASHSIRWCWQKRRTFFRDHQSVDVTKKTSTLLSQNSPDFKNYSVRSQSEIEVSVMLQVKAVPQPSHKIVLKATDGKWRPSSGRTNPTTVNIKYAMCYSSLLAYEFHFPGSFIIFYGVHPNEFSTLLGSQRT